ncbi:MAG: inositol phosphorylceramide synthase [Saprospiraceae bacterium]|nr:inositol phosphorylceramide synthase [Saprospiraceae bacterium]
MKAFPNYLFQDVSIRDLYDWEKRFFGIPYQGEVLTPNEYFAKNLCFFCDAMAGLCYINWVPVPLAFGFYLFVKDPYQLLKFSICFLVSNILGFILYYTYPAAPPWYVQQYGFDFIASTPGNAAGLLRVDALLNFDLYKGMYEKSSNVFAAFPSLHAAYPLVGFIYSVKNKYYKWSLVLGSLTIGIWWAAIYTQHHYVIDILAGIMCGLLGWLITEFVIQKSNNIRTLLRDYTEIIRIEKTNDYN